MKKVLAKWLLLWLRARKLPTLTDDEIVEFLLLGNQSNFEVLNKMKNVMGDDHVKMLNLSHDWLTSYLPFVLQKVNRVHFGLLQPKDIKQLEDDNVKIPTSRKLTAVPFVAKDVPSRASEFAHPDILIGLTVLAYRYEGLRHRDFFLVMKHMKDCLDDEGGPYKDRPSYQRFEQWILNAGRAIRGSKKKERRELRQNLMQIDDYDFKGSQGKKQNGDLIMKTKDNVERTIGKNVFLNIFSEEDELIWPLQLIEPKDQEQFRILYPLLTKLPHVVVYYLNEIIFPEVLAHQGLKLSACGQELGGDMLFGRRIGFSGTPSDILPLELGSCQYERGSDGKVVHYLTSPEVVSCVNIPSGWNVHSILNYVATVRKYNNFCCPAI